MKKKSLIFEALRSLNKHGAQMGTQWGPGAQEPGAHGILTIALGAVWVPWALWATGQEETKVPTLDMLKYPSLDVLKYVRLNIEKPPQ